LKAVQCFCVCGTNVVQSSGNCQLSVSSVLATRRAVHLVAQDKMRTGCCERANEPDVFVKGMEIIY